MVVPPGHINILSGGGLGNSSIDSEVILRGLVATLTNKYDKMSQPSKIQLSQLSYKSWNNGFKHTIKTRTDPVM